MRTVHATSLFILFLSAAAVASQPAEEWREMRYGELKIGMVCITRKTESKDGKSLRRTDVERQMNYFQGKQVTFTSRESFLETRDGKLVEVSYVSQSDQGETSIQGTIKGDKISYLIEKPNQASQQMEVDWKTETVGPRKAEELIAENLKAGASCRFTTYSFTVSSCVTMDCRVRGQAKVMINGKETEAICVAIQGDDLKGITRERFLDSRGRFVMEQDPCLGGRSEIACDSSEAARQARGVVAQYSLTGYAQVRGRAIHPRSCTAAIFHLSGEPSLANWDFRGPGQKVAAQGGGFTISTSIPTDSGGGARRPVDEIGMEIYLCENYTLDFSQGDIAAIANRVAGVERDCGRAAENLRTWVFENLKKKNQLNSGMASASTTLTVREGDSVEHAVLLAALCRSAGIPAKLVGGLQLAGGYLVPHAWTEVWTGRWEPMDATQKTRCDACRIRMLESDLNGPSAEAVLMNISALLRTITAELRTTTLGKRAVDASDPDRGAESTRGDCYQHGLYGFQIQKPAGYNFQTNLRGMPGAILQIGGGGRRGDRVLIRVSTVAYHFDYDRLIQSQASMFRAENLKRLTVGGHPAVMANMMMIRGGYSPLTCYVRVGDTLYTIEGPGPSPERSEAFRIALETMRFDK